jgi:thiol-disulfide isomerase/thioredoxin
MKTMTVLVLALCFETCSNNVEKQSTASENKKEIMDTIPANKPVLPAFKSVGEMEVYFKPKFDSIIAKRKLHSSQKADGGHDEAISKLDSLLMETQWEYNRARLNYVKHNHTSNTDMMQMMPLLPMTEISTAELSALYDLFPAETRTSHFGTQFKKLLNERIHKESNQYLDQSLLNHVFTSVDENKFTLSGVQAKYRLLEFWASWCMPCRVQNRKLAAWHTQAKEKNLVAIIAISLDANRDKWLKAIKDDKLDALVNVSDLKGWESAFVEKNQIKSIPFNLLIDSKGKILARNIPAEKMQSYVTDSLKATQ